MAERVKMAENEYEDIKTICGICSRVDCSWMRAFAPVSGWTAVKHDYKIQKQVRNEVVIINTHSYSVEKCPLFVSFRKTFPGKIREERGKRSKNDK